MVAKPLDVVVSARAAVIWSVVLLLFGNTRFAKLVKQLYIIAPYTGCANIPFGRSVRLFEHIFAFCKVISHTMSKCECVIAAIPRMRCQRPAQILSCYIFLLLRTTGVENIRDVIPYPRHNRLRANLVHEVLNRVIIFRWQTHDCKAWLG